MAKWIIRLENLAVAIVAIIVYWQLGFSWWLFFVFLLTPDVLMLGYLKNSHVGSIAYNAVHNYVLALGLIGAGYVVFQNDWLTIFGLILMCHIGLDRALGFGLKYPADFKQTHIQRL